jgi:hypothetical protein
MVDPFEPIFEQSTVALNLEPKYQAKQQILDFGLPHNNFSLGLINFAVHHLGPDSCRVGRKRTEKGWLKNLSKHSSQRLSITPKVYNIL